MSRSLATVFVVLSGVGLCQCKADRKQRPVPQPRIEFIDVGRLPPGLPEVPRSPDDYFPARPSTEEERSAYWRAQETRDETLCAQAGPRWMSRCMAHVAKLKADSSLCEQIDEAHKWARSFCYSGVALERQDEDLCSNVADESARSLCAYAHERRPFDSRTPCRSKRTASMKTICEQRVQKSILLDSLKAELRALQASYSLPHCEALTGRRLDIDYYVYERDVCYDQERRSGNHMACLEEAGPGLCLAFLSVAKKTFLCDAIPSALARMQCIKQLTAFGHDIETYSRAEVFRSTDAVTFEDARDLAEMLANDLVPREHVQRNFTRLAREPGVCDGPRLKKPRRISAGGANHELGQKITYLERCERVGSEWRVDLIGFR